MAYSYDDVMSGFKKEDENDRYDLPTFEKSEFKGEGALVFYKDAWLFRLLCPTKKSFRDLETFQFKDDIVVASFPKSGLTEFNEGRL